MKWVLIGLMAIVAVVLIVAVMGFRDEERYEDWGK